MMLLALHVFKTYKQRSTIIKNQNLTTSHMLGGNCTKELCDLGSSTVQKKKSVTAIFYQYYLNHCNTFRHQLEICAPLSSVLHTHKMKTVLAQSFFLVFPLMLMIWRGFFSLSLFVLKIIHITIFMVAGILYLDSCKQILTSRKSVKFYIWKRIKLKVQGLCEHHHQSVCGTQHCCCMQGDMEKLV